MNKIAHVFPGQGAQFPGMARDLYEKSPEVREMMKAANDLLGYQITDIMFEGSDEDLKQTKVTQPAIFLHSVCLSHLYQQEEKPEMVAGHSLGEFSALVAAGALDFESGLGLVLKRALAMQKACEIEKSTMAAILGLEDELVEKVCDDIDEVVVAANYNCPGQLVISGSISGVDKACEILKEQGARRALVLPVGGAFHSPFMQPAQEELSAAIMETDFSRPLCPVYQNFTAMPSMEPETIKQNLINQLTGPVRWTQSVQAMIADGASKFVEIGPGRALQGMVKKIDRGMEIASATVE